MGVLIGEAEGLEYSRLLIPSTWTSLISRLFGIHPQTNPSRMPSREFGNEFEFKHYCW